MAGIGDWFQYLANLQKWRDEKRIAQEAGKTWWAKPQPQPPPVNLNLFGSYDPDAWMAPPAAMSAGQAARAAYAPRAASQAAQQWQSAFAAANAPPASMPNPYAIASGQTQAQPQAPAQAPALVGNLWPFPTFGGGSGVASGVAGTPATGVGAAVNALTQPAGQATPSVWQTQIVPWAQAIWKKVQATPMSPAQKIASLQTAMQNIVAAANAGQISLEQASATLDSLGVGLTALQKQQAEAPTAAPTVGPTAPTAAPTVGPTAPTAAPTVGPTAPTTAQQPQFAPPQSPWAPWMQEKYQMTPEAYPGWYQQFQQQHPVIGGQVYPQYPGGAVMGQQGAPQETPQGYATPEQYYAQTGESLGDALADYEWSQKFLAQNGHPPTDYDWQLHWYVTRLKMTPPWLNPAQGQANPAVNPAYTYNPPTTPGR